MPNGYFCISSQVIYNCSAFGSSDFCVSFSRERKSERNERKLERQNPNRSLAWTILLEKRPYIWPSFTRLQSRSYWAYYKTQCGPESLFKFKNSKGRNKIFLGYVVYLNPLLRWLFLRKYWCICHFLKHINLLFSWTWKFEFLGFLRLCKPANCGLLSLTSLYS